MANVNPTFYGEGHTPVNHDSSNIILQKILGAIIDNGPGGGGGTIGTVDQGTGGSSAWLVTAASLPLPAGAATALLQTAGNASLSSLDGKTVHVDTGAVVVASSALPSGAATEATLSTLNGKVTACNTGAVVVSSSALPSGAATEASLVKLPLAQGSTTSGQSGILDQGAVTTAAPTYTTGQTSPLSLTTGGALRVDVSAGSVSGSVTVSNGAGASAVNVQDGGNSLTVDYATTGSGTATGALRVELPTNGTGVIGAVTAITNALPTGTNAIGTVQIGNTPNTTPILANTSDPTATSGNITTVDSGSATTTNSINQTIITGTPTANSSVTVSLNGQTAVLVQLSGTASQVLSFERSIDGGTTYTLGTMEELGIGTGVSSITISDNKAYMFRMNCAGFTNFRIRATTVTSGTVAVKAQPTWGTAQVPVNQGTPNSAVNSWAMNVAQVNGATTLAGNGASGTGAQRVTLASDSTGNIATIGTSVVPGTGATNLGKAEDAAAVDGDTGVFALAVRKASPVNTSGTDGDYEGLQVHAGRLWNYALMTPGTSYALTTATSSATQALTVGVKAITVYARGSDAYIKLGTGAQTAASSTVYMAAGERMDIDMSSFATPNIGYIWGVAATAGVLQVSELT